jgi:hypothetical protein
MPVLAHAGKDSDQMQCDSSDKRGTVPCAKALSDGIGGKAGRETGPVQGMTPLWPQAAGLWIELVQFKGKSCRW